MCACALTCPLKFFPGGQVLQCRRVFWPLSARRPRPASAHLTRLFAVLHPGPSSHCILIAATTMPAKVTKGSSEKATKASGKAAARKGVSALSKAAASSASSSSSSASSSSSSSDASSDEDDVEEGLPAAPSKSHKAKGKQRESSNDDEDGSGSDGSKEEEDSEDEGPTIDLDKIRKRMVCDTEHGSRTRIPAHS